MSDESASGSDPDLDPDVELEDAEEEEEEEEVAVEEHGGDGEEDLLGGEWPREARSRGLGVPRGLGPGGAGDARTWARTSRRESPRQPCPAGGGALWAPGLLCTSPSPPARRAGAGLFLFTSSPPRGRGQHGAAPRSRPFAAGAVAVAVRERPDGGGTKRDFATDRPSGAARPARRSRPGAKSPGQACLRPPQARAPVSPHLSGREASAPFSPRLWHGKDRFAFVFFLPTASSSLLPEPVGPPPPAPTAGPGVPSRRAERVEIVEERTEGAPADPCLALVVAKAASDSRECAAPFALCRLGSQKHTSR